MLAEAAIESVRSSRPHICANKIVSAHITEVVYAEPYVTAEAKDLLEANGIEIRRFEGVKSSAYFRLYPS